MEDLLKQQELGIKRRLLIVDDDEISGDILASFFDEDFHILRAYSGHECLDVLEKQGDAIDLVLLDNYMPNMTGLEILELRKNNKHLKNIPFVVITNEMEIEEKCFALGVNDFIRKPYERKDIIVARVKRMIELYEDRGIIKELKVDKLTGLYTSDFFKKYTQMFDTVYPGKAKDLIMLDISRFHVYNELYGMNEGDRILKEISNYIKGFLRGNPGLATRTADKFLIYTIHKEDGYEDFVNALVNIINSNSPTKIRLHAGIYPNVEEDLEKDVAIGRVQYVCNSIKDDLNKQIAIYDHNVQEKIVHDEELVNSFEDSLRNGEFVVYYQPKYAIQGEKNVLTSAEALIRWIHPKWGMISPGVFIPLFENNGLIQQLDNYVFRQVAKQQGIWFKKYGRYIPVSVNVSRVDIHNPNLEKELLDAVDEYHIPHENYLIEITESAYSNDNNKVNALTESLKSKGFKIEIDDFGAGYSSLNILSELTFDVIKIDMVFIRKMDKGEKNKGLLTMILKLCKDFNVTSVAEGVETEEHYKFLKENGCDVIQGYYFSKPLPANEFEKFIEKEN